MTGIFQSPEWEQFKLSTGYQAAHRIDDILVLQKKLPLGRSMLYSPMVDDDARIMSNTFLEQVKAIAKKEKAIFFRVEINIPIHNSSLIIHNSTFQKSFEEMQPEHTILLDLTKSEEELLAQMKQKGRYNIKVAEKNGVVVREEESIDNFYELYSTMAKRQKISYRNRDYFQKLFDIMSPKGYVKVFTGFATKEQSNRETEEQKNNEAIEQWNNEIPIASAIVSFYGDQAIYLFGGSSNQHRNLMAPYLVQWTAIKQARAARCKSYDFFGIAPDNNPKHPWQGVTRFKRQFGDNQVDIIGSYDLVFRPLEYQLFKIAEKIRRK